MLALKRLAMATVTMGALMLASGTASAAECKGMTKTACTKATACTWVKGYTTKTGTKVDSYCRNAGKKASKKKASTKKKTTAKDTKAKAETVKKETKAKAAKPKAEKKKTAKPAKKSTTKKPAKKKKKKN